MNLLWKPVKVFVHKGAVYNETAVSFIWDNGILSCETMS